MSRIKVAVRFPSVPGSVALGDLAIAAGFAGRCVTLCCPDHPAPPLCQLWLRHPRYLTFDRMFQIQNQRDGQTLLAHVFSVRSLLLHTPRLHNALAWSIHMAGLIWKITIGSEGCSNARSSIPSTSRRTDWRRTWSPAPMSTWA